MKDFRLNPNADYVNRIIAGILKNDGHCPCRMTADDTTLCPCDDFVTNGVCKCNLFVKREPAPVLETKHETKKADAQ